MYIMSSNAFRKLARSYQVQASSLFKSRKAATYSTHVRHIPFTHSQQSIACRPPDPHLCLYLPLLSKHVRRQDICRVRTGCPEVRLRHCRLIRTERKGDRPRRGELFIFNRTSVQHVMAAAAHQTVANSFFKSLSCIVFCRAPTQLMPPSKTRARPVTRQAAPGSRPSPQLQTMPQQLRIRPAQQLNPPRSPLEAQATRPVTQPSPPRTAPAQQ